MGADRVPDALRAGPFTAATAARYGVSRHTLRGPAWRQLFRGAWLAADLPLDRAMLLAAARLVLPVDAVLCGVTAAESYGVDVRRLDDLTVHAGFEDVVPRPRPGLALRSLTLPPDEVVARDGWLVTTALRTAFDCARWLPCVDAVVVVDALAHAGLFTLDALAEFARRHPGLRWVTRVATVIDLAEPLSESPMESRLRLLLVRAGLPRPSAQLVVRDRAGQFVARVDLAYEAARLIVEYDGADHWQQRRADDRRRDRLRALGWTVLVYSAEDYYQTPHEVVTQVGRELRRAA